MTLTMGTGPFGHRPAGHPNVTIPADDVLFAGGAAAWFAEVRGR